MSKLEFGKYYTLPANTKVKFKSLEENRKTTAIHIRDLCDSLVLFDDIQTRPVLVAEIPWIGKGLYRIDASHLDEALRDRNLPITYMVIPIKDNVDLIRKIAMLNCTSKPWSLHDYISMWATINTNYAKLGKYYPKFTLDICNLASILSGNGPTNGGKPSKLIKSGDFEIINEKATVEFLKKLQSILKIGKSKTSRHTRYVASEYYNYMAVCQKYNHEQFMNHLNKDDLKLRIATNVAGDLFKNISLT